MIKRLIYTSRKRGILETDLLLSTFADLYLEGMTKAELLEFDSLMEEPDWYVWYWLMVRDLYYWFTESRPPPEKWAESSILKRLIVHSKNEKKDILRMPELQETETT
jgi:succinate dehydrogenase assembly factor 2